MILGEDVDAEAEEVLHELTQLTESEESQGDATDWSKH